MPYTLIGSLARSVCRFSDAREHASIRSYVHGQKCSFVERHYQDPRYGKTAPYDGESAGHPPVRSYLAVPVRSRAGEVLGGLFFGHPDPGRFEDAHAQLVQGVAAQAAIALDNARLFAEVQRSEEALRASNVELRQANTDLEQFAYAAAHDLQEPLRMVTSYTQLLDRSLTDRLDERTRSFMAYIVGGATRMSLLLQDLLAYTETSRTPDKTEKVCLNRVLQQVLKNLQPAIEEAGATFWTSRCHRYKDASRSLCRFYRI